VGERGKEGVGVEEAKRGGEKKRGEGIQGKLRRVCK